MTFLRRDIPLRAYAYLAVGFVLAGGSLWIFAELVDEILEKEVQLWDAFAYFVLQSYASYGTDVVMYWLTAMGSGVSVVGLSFAFLLWWGMFRRELRTLYLFLIANAGGLGFNLFLKYVLQRDRPSLNPDIGAVGYSLPSGHAMGAMVFYGFLAYLIIRSQRRGPVSTWALSAVLLTFIVGIGVSRVYLNAHYASDVFAGFFAGCFWLSACIFALEVRPWYQKYWKPEANALR